MKKLNILSLFILGTLLITSCEKSADIQITGDNLTVCETNYDCSNTFYPNSDIENDRYKVGNYRVFESTKILNASCGIKNSLYFKAPMDGNSFKLGVKDIKNGKVVNLFSCDCCLGINYKPVSGFVKGINTTPEKSDSQSTWLIEASIILEAEINGIEDRIVRDTVNIKQYFVHASPEF